MSSTKFSFESLDFIRLNLSSVLSKIEKAHQDSTYQTKKPPCLLAASKTQPKEYIIKAYQCGQRHFGENYIQELHEKSNDSEVLEKCPEIKWHIIGHIQSNKINKLLDCPKLYLIQTVDSIKLAEALNAHLRRHEGKDGKMNVFVQVNTSNEEAKSGIDLEGVFELIDFINNKCEHLNFMGLMTIGIYGFDTTKGTNPDFLKLIEVRNQVCEKFNLEKASLELSFGMSSDFEQAVSLGSTIVRVGTSIFGPRKYKI